MFPFPLRERAFMPRADWRSSSPRGGSATRKGKSDGGKGEGWHAGPMTGSGGNPVTTGLSIGSQNSQPPRVTGSPGSSSLCSGWRSQTRVPGDDKNQESCRNVSPALTASHGEGCAERPKAASVAQTGQPLSAPRGGLLPASVSFSVFRWQSNLPTATGLRHSSPRRDGRPA